MKTVFLLQFLICIVNGNRLSSEEILGKLLTNYKRNIRPRGIDSKKGDGGPVVVTVNMYLRRIEVNDEEHEHTVQVTFRQTWTDPRLAYNSFANERQAVPVFVVLNSEPNKPLEIWSPDTFLQNEVEDSNTDSDRANSLIRIYGNGNVLYSKKFTATFFCAMTAHHYPFDTQSCSIEIASYGYTSDDIIYEWKKESSVQFKQNTQFPSGFYIADYNVNNCTSLTSTGEYSCIRLILQFRRESTLATHKVFHYSFVIVFASWVPFWLEPMDVAARSFIGVACLVTTVFFNHLMTDGTLIANISYSNPIRLWTEATLAFVFLAFVQIILVTLLSSIQRSIKTRGYDFQLRDMLNEAEEDSQTQRSTYGTKTKWAKIFDIICRFLFPIAYAIFNIVFWTTMF